MASTQEVESAVKGISKIWPTIRDRPGMMGTALVFDLLSAIPWVGMIFSGLGYATLWLWMEIEGMKPGFGNDTKRIAQKAGSILGEIGLGAVGAGFVPFIVIWAFFVIAEHKGEIAKKEQASAAKAVEGSQDGNKIAGEIKPGEERQKTSAYWEENRAA